MTRATRARLALLAVGVVAVSGCGSARQPAAERPALSPAAARLIVPTAASEGDAVVLDRASTRLTRRCMAARGFRYHAPPPVVVPVSALPPAGGGYGIYEMVRDAPAGAFAAAPDGGELARGYMRALDGTQGQRATVHPRDGVEMSYATSGCQTRASAELYGSLAAYYTDLARRNGVVTRLGERMPGDAALRRATANWRACMRGRGHRFRSPQRAREAVLARAVHSRRPGRIRTFELRVAAADRACGITSGVYGRQRAFDRAVIAAITPADRAVLEQLARSRGAVVKRARAIVSASPSP